VWEARVVRQVVGHACLVHPAGAANKENHVSTIESPAEEPPKRTPEEESHVTLLTLAIGRRLARCGRAHWGGVHDDDKHEVEAHVLALVGYRFRKAGWTVSLTLPLGTSPELQVVHPQYALLLEPSPGRARAGSPTAQSPPASGSTVDPAPDPA
jgi:hypothetical protein